MPRGYIVDSGKNVYHEYVHRYMNCEYVRRRLTDEERLLIPIGNNLKGEIDLGVFLQTHRLLLGETVDEADEGALEYIENRLR